MEALERLASENIALRCLLGAGCDANEDGPHRTIVKNSTGEFCADCGEMTRNGKSKPWMDEARLQRVIDRLSTPTDGEKR